MKELLMTHDLVAASALAVPQALALADGEQRMTYRELDGAAERLANQLRCLGVGPEVIVALCLPRSVAMVVGALGVLKAGGAYLPLDPTRPAERLAQLLDAARPSVVVTADWRADRVPRGEWHVLALDQHGDTAGPAAPERRPVPISGETLAYVIYTSGSTGEPKGVQITHAGLLNLVRWHERAFAVTPTDRATQIASVAFDAAVWELWPYLAVGASVHVPGDAIRQDAEALRDWLVQERISITFLSTPMAEGMLDLRWPMPGTLRVLLTGADTLRRYPPADLPFALVNNYGPTECTVVATSGRVDHDPHPNAAPTIGRPIDNVSLHVLDTNLQPAPPATPGELYIGGAGVARGYLNRPDLTAQSFIPDPFSVAPGRLYKTGDLGCRLPDGQIAFLGRIDHQVKIRGQRVEPAEIVAVLGRHPTVCECAVVAQEAAPGDQRLSAYVVPSPGTRPTLDGLRDFLAECLPDYMVPSTFKRVDCLPRTASGKLDRVRLVTLESAELLQEDNAFVAARTPVERRVAEILAPLLGLERVGVLDNFFMQGGHSMLGTQLIGRLRETFGVELSLRALFDAPTVAGLASEVERLLIAKVQAISEAEAERMLQ